MNKTERDQVLYKAFMAIFNYAKMNGGLDSFIANGYKLLDDSPDKLVSNPQRKVRIKFNRCICSKCTGSTNCLS